MLWIVLVSRQPQHDCETYKSATIALAVIAIASVAINILLTIYFVRKIPKKGLFIRLQIKRRFPKLQMHRHYNRIRLLIMFMFCALFQMNSMMFYPDTSSGAEDRSRPTETGSSSDYMSINMAPVNAGVVYDSLQPA